MRLVAVPLVLVSIILVAAGDLACAQVSVNGSITRLDADTWQLRCGFDLTGPFPENPPPTCREHYYLSFWAIHVLLEGPFGTPENPLWPDDAYVEPNQVFWSLPGPDQLGFDFRVGESLSQLVLNYSITWDWLIETWACWDAPDPCPAPCSGGEFAGRDVLYTEELQGRLYADLPQTVGDSAPLREIPVAVDRGTWGQIKQLFR